MNESSGENLSASIERLINRIEILYNQQSVKNDQMDNMLSQLVRISEMLVRIEEGKNFETELTKKILLLHKSLESTMNKKENMLREQEGMDKTIRKIADGMKIFGRILSIVATGIQLTVDNIGTVLNDSSRADHAAAGKSPAAGTQVDLASMLQPVSALVKNLVEEKMKRQDQAGDGDVEHKGAGDSGKMRPNKE
ncbi:MAG: hypothetical protein K6T65_05210 [Peptococcaceae bacterium]|nr:hypothetical protein [Peptococcaceae bacterium]